MTSSQRRLLDQRPPEKLQDPGQPEKGRQADAFQADAHVAEKNRGDGTDDGEGETFGKIGAEAPDVRVF
jgi:hypothetical protein